MNDDRKGDWIQTVTGRRVWPLDPRPEDFCVGDVAHALSMLCRFTGHTKTFYSVAEHSIRCARAAAPQYALAALLHDAAEAYMADIARPWKRFLYVPSEVGYVQLKQAERTLLVVIVNALTDPPRQLATPERDAEIERVDLLLLATEARDLMAPLHPDWHHCEANGYPVLPDRIEPWSPGKARWEFLDTYRRLTEKSA